MNEQEPLFRSYGGSFQVEVALLQSLADSPLFDQQVTHADLTDFIRELEAHNPYLGQKVTIDAVTPVSLVDESTGQGEYLHPGRHECVINGFFPYFEHSEDITDTTYYPQLGVELGFDDPAYSNFIGQINAEDVIGIELVDSTNPFSVDHQRFKQAVEKFEEAELMAPDLRAEDFVDEYVRWVINRNSVVSGNMVEVIFCEITSMDLVSEAMLPAWMEDGYDPDDDDDDEYTPSDDAELEDKEVELTDIEYRGTLRGTLHSYEMWEDDDGGPTFAAILEISPDHPLALQNVRYAIFWVEDVSGGRILGGPITN